MGSDYAVQVVDRAAALNFLDILQDANFVVQIVVLLLLLLSIYSWSVIFGAARGIKLQRKRIGFFSSLLNSGNVSVEELYGRIDLTKQVDKRDCMATNMIAAAFDLIRLGRKESNLIESSMRMEVERTLFNKERSMSNLASVSSMAPFIGLFGTIIGIMHSFSSIFSVHTISLRIVAPSIAEALFATAMGIFVAVPAGIFYNKLAYDVRSLKKEAESLVYSVIRSSK